MKLPGQTPDASKVYIHIYMKQQIRGLYKQGCLKVSLGGRRGKSSFSVSQATLSDLHEGFDMSSLGGIWTSFAVVGDTPGLEAVW